LFYTTQIPVCLWFVRREKRARRGEVLFVDARKLGTMISRTQRELTHEVIARSAFGERRLRFSPVDDFFATVEAIGHIPLPPYIARADASADHERYQTVYAQQRGSVAAPTAGLAGEDHGPARPAVGAAKRPSEPAIETFASVRRPTPP